MPKIGSPLRAGRQAGRRSWMRSVQGHVVIVSCTEIEPCRRSIRPAGGDADMAVGRALDLAREALRQLREVEAADHATRLQIVQHHARCPADRLEADAPLQRGMEGEPSTSGGGSGGGGGGSVVRPGAAAVVMVVVRPAAARAAPAHSFG